MKFYVRSKDRMQIGDANLENILYGFYKGRFYAVTIRFKDLQNCLKLLDTFTEAYGEFHQPNSYLREYFWFRINVNVFLDYKETLNKGTVTYMFNAIQKEEDSDNKAKAKKGVGDL